jgi:hypothetical protein
MRIILKPLLLVAMMATAVPAIAQIRINVNVAPPVAVHEAVVAAPSPGVVWVPGYYLYSGSKYVWTPGHWQAPPAPQQVWVAPRYVHSGDHYVYYPGRWRTKTTRVRTVAAPEAVTEHHDNGKHKGWYKQNEMATVMVKAKATVTARISNSI